ncbi:MAG TPA: uroporphyrinogen decarboxylase family protein [Anaerovoracaceae bacterium]|nr:uroporphyrinogen decarboxylase family protein [Anaerovoracaceae bacterium]
MNSMERMNLTLQHKEADRVPVYPLLNSVSRKALGISYEEWTRDTNKCAEAIVKATEEIGADCICTLVDLTVEAADWGQEVVYHENDAANPNMDNRLIKTVEDYDKIGVINPRETPRMSEHIKLAKLLYEAKGQEMPIIGFVFAPLGVLSMMRGQETMFVDLIKHPDKMKSALQNITETLKEYCTALIEAGCHAIMFDTLYASRSIMSPKMWDENEGIYMEELSNHVREQGAMVMLHNCGAGAYFKEQIDRMDPIAISYQHLPLDCADMAEVKEKYGDKVTLIGHVEPGWMFSSTEEEVREVCREQIDAYKKGGGFILATGCEYPSSLDFTYAKAMADEAKTYGKY